MSHPVKSGDYIKFYERYIHGLLPAIYQAYDTQENNVLEEFLKIIASQAAAIRQDIDGLLNNFFINSCDEWVIPYIADLIAARVFPNSSLNSRLEVHNAMRWRKLKGTLIGLEEAIGKGNNRKAIVKEAFRDCSSSFHTAFERSEIIVNKAHNFVNLRDQNAVRTINTENDNLPHMIDVREPTQTSGWHNTKNLLIFLPQLNVYHISRVQAEGEGDGRRFYFSNRVQKKQQHQLKQPPSSSSLPYSHSSYSSSFDNSFPLYDLDQGVKIMGVSFAQDPFKYFGKRRGMSVKIDNILAACNSAPTFSPAKQQANALNRRVTIATAEPLAIPQSNSGKNHNDASQSDYDSDDRDSNSDDNNDNNNNNNIPDFISFHRTEGLRILEPRKFDGQDKGYVIRLYSYSKKTGPIELANYNTTRMSYHLLTLSRVNKRVSGTILISIELDSKMNEPAEFPETAIAIRDSRDKNLVESSVDSKYRNALYVYLPSILVDDNEKKYFFVDKDGSTDEVQMINGKYESDIESAYLGRLRDNKNLRKRISPSTQIFPPRQLTYSMQPLRNFAELNRFMGIKAVDAKKYAGESFLIEAIAINRDKDQAWKIGKLKEIGGILQYINEKEVWIRWTMILGDPHNNNIRYPLPVCHFKATRLDPHKNFREIPGGVIEIVESVLPDVIKREDASDSAVGTFRIDPPMKIGDKENNKKKPNPTYEYEVKVTIRPEYHNLFGYLGNKIKNMIENKPEFANEGKLMLRISRKNNTSGDFPLSEIILTNSSSRSILVYLPQLGFDSEDGGKEEEDEKIYDLYVTDDGSTSRQEEFLEPARKSAGQVIPIPGKYPLQHRIPIYANLDDWRSVGDDTVHFGELAIDPEHGRFAFSKEDKMDVLGDNELAGVSSVHVTADYNYAFSGDVGAGAYDRGDSLKKKKPTKWISKQGHTPHSNAFPSKTFRRITDAFASAKDGDVIQIEDSAIYEEDLTNNSIDLHSEVRNLTLQAANWTMPMIRSKDKLSFELKHSLKRIELNGILITGGPLIVKGNFNKLALTSCTIDPGFGEDERLLEDIEKRRFGGIRTEQHDSERKKDEKHTDYGDSASDTSTTNNEYKIQLHRDRSSKEISLTSSICGGIILDDSVSLISLEDSIVHNTGGPAISFNEYKKRDGIRSTLKLKAKRSNILSEYLDDDHVLDLENICCSDSILTNTVSVNMNKKQMHLTDNDNNCRNSLVRCRYEQSSPYENIGIDNNITVVNCTTDKPIFISTTFGHPAYLHLDPLNSKSILEGAEDTLEMGAFNKSYKPLRMRNLNLRLREYLPIGIKSGVIYIY